MCHLGLVVGAGVFVGGGGVEGCVVYGDDACDVMMGIVVRE